MILALFWPHVCELMFRLALPADNNIRKLAWPQQLRNGGYSPSGKEVPKTYSPCSDHMVTDAYLHIHLK